eukprot:TRINITY_DN1549_c0_g1::TRINITY_DN1549_c0_g1_i1::g.28148::m.28148 TRINITY_DN1549_c0_g1::TRINITY_DN1549_c0_g1_i1::g.28148  ORF type:complete len:319 (+),score=38.93,sp/Q9GKT2/FXDC2_MACFA/44.24/1e-83,FA_hydroxylase/PF04116.8/5.1e+02,FA_hydroxylase/PF04116.8/9.7e-17,FA_hydroxylase/PF04116.8/1.5e+04 TRINITY_DN1549_c0_g1_i1:64-957(+)
MEWLQTNSNHTLTLDHAPEGMLESVWEYLVRAFGYSDYNMYVYGTFLFHIVTYWGFGLLYILIDLYGGPAFLKQYKIQPGQNEPLNRSKFRRAIGLVLLNQVIVNLPLSIFTFPLAQWRGMRFSYPLPSLFEVAYNFAGFLLVEEIGFYYSHRLFHAPFFYKRIHKIHHEWQAPISITAIYAHPLEHFIANLAPVFMGPLVMGSHMSVAWLWYTIAVMNTLNSHSGYHFPGFPSPEYHDYHHLKFNTNYGVLGILDSFHGTKAMWLGSKAHERHKTFFSLVPMRVQVPDGPADKKKR